MSLGDALLGVPVPVNRELGPWGQVGSVGVGSRDKSASGFSQQAEHGAVA